MSCVYRYDPDEAGKLFPVQVNQSANDSGAIQLSKYIVAWWWTGWMICESCSKLWVGIVKVGGATGKVPKGLCCPHCAASSGTPEAYWTAAAEASCGACGHVWKEVLLDKRDIVPERVQCPRCQEFTSDFKEWP